jgi:hypothetical protein
VPIVCLIGSDPNGAELIVSGPEYLQTYALSHVGGTTWEITFPTPPGNSGDTLTLTLMVYCGGTTIGVKAGALTLLNPSGLVTDAATGEPISEAAVTLQRMDGGSWVDVNPYETAGDPPSPTSSPRVNPQLTDTDGHHAWDAIGGQYRVVVEKVGYVTETSTPVTVPPALTGLNVELDADADGDGIPNTIDEDDDNDSAGQTRVAVGGACPTGGSPGPLFGDCIELCIETDPLDACPDSPTDDAWPLDLNMDTQISIVGDVFNYRGRVGATPGSPSWWKRLDLNCDGQISIVGDVFPYRGMIGTVCTNP